MILINIASPNRMGMISHYSAVTLPINVGILAGYLLSKGRRVEIVDELIDPIDESLENIKRHLEKMTRPYIFGISCLTINIGRGLEIAKLIKASYPDSKVIFGGIHPTVLPDESLNSQAVDIVVRGEGEETLLLLYDAIKNNKSYSGIVGISFKEDGRIRHNQDKALVEDLDTISKFPYELFDPAKYNLGFVITTRGCPYNCIFCSQRHVSGRRYRFRSNEAVVQEIDLLVSKYGQQQISFLDDNFLVNKKRIKTLCDLIVQKKLHTKARFACQTRADNVNEETLGYLKRAGFLNVGMGIETGSERLMQIINKGETVKDNIKAARLLKKMGFVISAFFMFGLPSETKKERFNTYMLAKGLRLQYAKFNNIVPYPGTRLFEIARKEGALNIEENWRNFNSVGGVVEGIFSRFKLPYVPKGNKERTLKGDLVRANLCFYLSKPSTLSSLLKRENPDWFSLSKRWYLDIKEYYHLLRLVMRVLINSAAVFDLQWVVKEVLWHLRGRRFDIE